MKRIHPTQQKLLVLLRKNIEDPLTIEELKVKLGSSSKSVVHHHIEQLEKKGFLKRNPGNSRDYALLGSPDKPIVYINKYGLAKCGRGESILDGHPIDKIPIASRLLRFSAEDAFIVEAKGSSMMPRINPGDLVIAKKQTNAENGEIVVCINNQMPIIKRFTKKNRMVILQSLNTENGNDPFIASDDFKIEGVVKNILHYEL